MHRVGQFEDAESRRATSHSAPDLSFSTQKQGLRPFALITSLLAHVIVLAVAIFSFVAVQHGGRGQELAGLEFELVGIGALESLTRAPGLAGGSAVALSEDIGTPQAMPLAPTTSSASPQSNADLTVLEAQKSDAALALETAQPEIQSQSTPSPNADTGTPPSVPTGGAQAESAHAVSAPASTGAAAGDIARYAADVRRILSRNRPRTDWPSGVVQITFTVADGGGVAEATITKPSGNARLDRLARDWIASTRFPAPPLGMAMRERTYDIPLTIRAAK